MGLQFSEFTHAHTDCRHTLVLSYNIKVVTALHELHFKQTRMSRLNWLGFLAPVVSVIPLEASVLLLVNTVANFHVGKPHALLYTCMLDSIETAHALIIRPLEMHG